MNYPNYDGHIDAMKRDIRDLARVTGTPPELLGVSLLEEFSDQITAISEWIDDHNGGDSETAEQDENRLWGRTAKVSEEIGEAARVGLPEAGTALLAILNGHLTEAVIGSIGQNPRKGVTHSGEDIDKELFDIALTALGARESRNGNTGGTMKAFIEHVARVHTRAGLD